MNRIIALHALQLNLDSSLLVKMIFMKWYSLNFIVNVTATLRRKFSPSPEKFPPSQQHLDWSIRECNHYLNYWWNEITSTYTVEVTNMTSQSLRQLRSVFDPQYSLLLLKTMDDVIKQAKMTRWLWRGRLEVIWTQLMSNLSAGPTKYFSTANDRLIKW